MQKQVLPRFGNARAITNGGIRQWVSDLLARGLSAATTRKAVFALRQCLDAAIADNRLQFNPATAVPLPTERQKPPRYLSQSDVERLVDEMPLSIARSCWSVRTPDFGGGSRGTAQTRHGPVALPHPRHRHSGRATRPRDFGQRAQDDTIEAFCAGRSLSVMRRLELHLSEFVGPTSDALVFTAPAGGPLFRSWGRTVLRPAVLRAGLEDVTFHGLRHSFVAIMVAAGCNVREVSEWAGHNSVAFTLTRYGGLFEDNTDAAIDRLDALLGGLCDARESLGVPLLTRPTL